jgi:hypothetical protein
MKSAKEYLTLVSSEREDDEKNFLSTKATLKLVHLRTAGHWFACYEMGSGRWPEWSKAVSWEAHLGLVRDPPDG